MSQQVRYFINTPRVTHETIDGEAIVVDFESGTYFSLRDVASWVWSSLGGGATVGELSEAVRRRFDGDEEEIGAAVQRFVEELEAEHLVARGARTADTPPSDPTGEAGPQTRSPFVSPKLEKFTDMQELLLMDPIHEVAETGWPEREPESEQ
jgi:Coenzyme PQQ synthesis protein D (PqqD)